MDKLILKLKRVRLERNLTYDQLAADLAMSRRNVIRLLTDPDATMQERTRFRISQYVSAWESEQVAAS